MSAKASRTRSRRGLMGPAGSWHSPASHAWASRALPPDVETVVAVRDGDPAEFDADLALWRGVARLMGQGVAVLITPMPSVVAGGRALKDINDLHQSEPSPVPKLLDKATAPQGKMSDKVLHALLDEASRLDKSAYERSRQPIASLLGFRVKAVDEARAGRIKERLRLPAAANRWSRRSRGPTRLRTSEPSSTRRLLSSAATSWRRPPPSTQRPCGRFRPMFFIERISKSTSPRAWQSKAP